MLQLSPGLKQHTGKQLACTPVRVCILYISLFVSMSKFVKIYKLIILLAKKNIIVNVLYIMHVC